MTMTGNTEPLEMRALERSDVDGETADLRFDSYSTGARDVYAEMEIKWGSTPRQRRIYTLGRDDLWSLHEWLTKVLGLDDDED